MLKDYYHLWSNGTRYTRSHHKRITGAIAREKGDNIVRVVLLFRFFALSTFQTVIFDCCHSASGTRVDKIDLDKSVRDFEIKHPGLNSKLLGLERGARIRLGSLHKGLRSRALLAAWRMIVPPPSVLGPTMASPPWRAFHSSSL
jgi:hypothetical protein